MNDLRKERYLELHGQGPTGMDNDEIPIRVNGKQQVIEMLRLADAAFREQILRGIEKKDPRLARELRALIYSV